MKPMKSYTCHKRVLATPMNRGDYNAYRGWTVPEDENPSDSGYLVEYVDGGPPNDERHIGYISWSPEEVFNKGYSEDGADFFDFGEALRRLKAGKKLARKGWNGIGMFAYYVDESAYPARMNVIKGVFEGDQVPYRAYLALKTAQNDVAAWTPSTSDSLADDWMEV